MNCTSKASPNGIPRFPKPLRGTYGGLASKPSIQYLKRLGVNAVELMPVHAFLTDKHLADEGPRQLLGL